MGDKRQLILLALAFGILFFSALSFVSSAIYLSDVYFTVPESVYVANETISLKGFVYQANYTDAGALVNASAALANATVNLSLRYSNRTHLKMYNFTTDANGSFYSKNNFRTTATEVNAPLVAGNYILQANYTDLNSNASVSGTFREAATKNTVSGKTFSCVTGTNGRCNATLSAPSVGDYVVEIETFKAYSIFSVVPFSYNLYMKDELGKSLKNVFTSSEQASVEVRINNVSSGTYTFSGYVQNSAGNNVKTITSTTLNTTNYFTNKFIFSLSGFSSGVYTAYVTISNSANSDTINSLTSFKVEDWTLSVNKKSSGSG